MAKAYKAINRKQRDGKGASGIFEEMRAPASVGDGAAKVLAMPEDTLEEIEAKSRAWTRLLSDPNWLTLNTACDMYVAAFLLPKIGDAPDPRHTGLLPLPTTDAIWRTVRGGDVKADMQANCIEVAEANRVFHWPLEFPAVMARAASMRLSATRLGNGSSCRNRSSLPSATARSRLRPTRPSVTS